MDSFFDFDTLHHHLNDNPNPVTNKTARGADASREEITPTIFDNTKPPSAPSPSDAFSQSDDASFNYCYRSEEQFQTVPNNHHVYSSSLPDALDNPALFALPLTSASNSDRMGSLFDFGMLDPADMQTRLETGGSGELFTTYEQKYLNAFLNHVAGGENHDDVMILEASSKAAAAGAPAAATAAPTGVPPQAPSQQDFQYYQQQQQQHQPQGKAGKLDSGSTTPVSAPAAPFSFQLPPPPPEFRMPMGMQTTIPSHSAPPSSSSSSSGATSSSSSMSDLSTLSSSSSSATLYTAGIQHQLQQHQQFMRTSAQLPHQHHLLQQQQQQQQQQHLMLQMTASAPNASTSPGQNVYEFQQQLQQQQQQTAPQARKTGKQGRPPKDSAAGKYSAAAEASPSYAMSPNVQQPRANGSISISQLQLHQSPVAVQGAPSPSPSPSNSSSSANVTPSSTSRKGSSNSANTSKASKIAAAAQAAAQLAAQADVLAAEAAASGVRGRPKRAPKRKIKQAFDEEFATEDEDDDDEGDDGMGAGDMDNEDGLNGERRLSLSQTNRELLSEEEKRMNHIMSEKKRRNNIREAFKTMTDIIPSLRNTNFSKATILNKANEYLVFVRDRNNILLNEVVRLRKEMQKAGLPVPTDDLSKLSAENDPTQWISDPARVHLARGRR